MTKYPRIPVTLDRDTLRTVKAISKRKNWTLSQTVGNLVKIGLAFSPDIPTQEGSK